MEISNRTLWCSLWNDNPGANKNQHVELIDPKEVPPLLFQVMARIVKFSNSYGLEGGFDSEIWYLPNLMVLKSILRDNNEPGL